MCLVNQLIVILYAVSFAGMRCIFCIATFGSGINTIVLNKLFYLRKEKTALM